MTENELNKETKFLIYCMERYRFYKGLSGKEAAELFDKWDIYAYVLEFFDALHVMGDMYILDDIDAYIARKSEESKVFV